MIRLRDAEFAKLAEITGIADYDLRKLYHMGLVKERSALYMLVRHDFRKIYSKRMYTRSQIVERLSEYYQISRKTLSVTLAGSEKKRYFCDRCNGMIGHAMYVRNNGLCDKCVAKTIDIP